MAHKIYLLTQQGRPFDRQINVVITIENQTLTRRVTLVFRTYYRIKLDHRYDVRHLRQKTVCLLAVGTEVIA